MIPHAPIVERLRASCASLRAVDGAAEFAAVAGRVTTHPAAWVIPLGESAGENRFSAGFATAQRVDTTFGVVLVVGDVSDQQGAAATELLTAIRREVQAALLGWMPAEATQPLVYAGGDALRFEAGLIWWQDEYTTAWEARAIPGASA